MRDEYGFSKGKRAPVIPCDPSKVRITIRLDADIVDYFKSQVHQAGGGNYQTMINSALREFISAANRIDIDENAIQRLREEGMI